MRLRILGALAAGTLIAGVGVGVSSGLVTSASHPHPNPTVAVSPSTRLVDFQKVLVVGSHFSAFADLASVECEPGAVDQSSCDLSTLVYTNANSHGAMLLHRYVRRIINVGGTSVDCAAPNACILGVGNVEDLTEAAGASISFNRHVPPVPTTLTAVPSTKLRDHQLIEVVGHGFNPGSSLQVAECTATEFDCAYETTRFVEVSGTGSFTIHNFAVEREFVSFDPTGESTIDCAVSRTTCVLQAEGNFGGVVNGSLRFDPSIPPVVPAIAVSPSTNLGDLQLVTVTGFGYMPGSEVFVSECTAETFACDPGSQSVTAGFQGQFKLTMAVHRLIAGGGPNGVLNTDCASHLGACTISASGTNGFTLPPSVALEFNPTKPPIKATITVTPHSNLDDNQRVAVTVGGFAPFRPVALVECSAAAVSEQNLSYCDANTEGVATADAHGNASTAFFVHRQISGEDGLVNCSSKPGACVLLAAPFQFFGYFGGTTTVTAPAAAAAHAAGVGRALPAPDLKGRAVQAAPGSSIPGIAVAALNFR